MNNYKKMQEAARCRFLEYDYRSLCGRSGITPGENGITTRFLGQKVEIARETGSITVGGHPAGFGESLTLYDWLCDSKPGACATNRFCKINSLPGVLVSGSNLELNGDSVAPLIAQNREKFLRLCSQMNGEVTSGADLAVVIWPLPDLPMLLKFYEADEDFPATLALLWDENILQFMRYETVYYLAGCLISRIRMALQD